MTERHECQEKSENYRRILKINLAESVNWLKCGGSGQNIGKASPQYSAIRNQFFQFIALLGAHANADHLACRLVLREVNGGKVWTATARSGPRQHGKKRGIRAGRPKSFPEGENERRTTEHRGAVEMTLANFSTAQAAGIQSCEARIAASSTALRVSSSRSGVMRTMGVERLMAAITGPSAGRRAAL